MTVEGLVTLVLSYVLWPLLTLAVLGLWVAAATDIARHRHGEAFTNVKLSYMATLVSVVAVVAIAGIGATFGGQWSEAVSSATADGTQAKRQEGVPPRAYLFSFGLEHASDSSPADPGTQRGPGPRS